MPDVIPPFMTMSTGVCSDGVVSGSVRSLRGATRMLGAPPAILWENASVGYAPG